MHFSIHLTCICGTLAFSKAFHHSYTPLCILLSLFNVLTSNWYFLLELSILLSPNVYSQLRAIRKLNARQRPFSSVAFWYSYLCCCNKRGIRACDPRQFSFQLDSYQRGPYQDPPSNPAVRSWISLKSISWSSIMLTGADLRVCHWKDNHLERKHGLQQ